MTWRFRWWLADWWPFLLAGLVVVGVLVAFLMECSARRACEARGGHVEEYNHRTIMLTQSCGQGCFVTVPVAVSDWRCVESR